MHYFPLFLALILASLGCGGDEPKSEGPSNGNDTGDSRDSKTVFSAVVVTGTITWTLDFDEDGEATGMEDCSYTREFTGTQLLDMDYLCPACTVQVQGTATMTEGLDCYGQISSSASTERTEHWGWSDTHFYRIPLTQYPLAELQEFTNNGEGEESTLAWSSEGELPDGGSLVMTTSGSLSWFIDDDTLLADPWPTQTAPYTCGWPQEDPGTLVLDYTLAEGNTFPNVRLEDSVW